MIWFLALILFVLLITVGGERGASAVLALCGNIGVLALTVLLLASGKPPLLIIPVAAVLISYLTLMKQNGSNLKTKTAFLTVAVVMAVLSVGICVGVWKTGSAGLNEIQAVQEDVQFYYTTDLVISMQQVAVGVVLLSALGAVMDTALSVTSAVYEVAVHRKDLDRSAYFRSGIEVGKEIIGTTVNTLVFAYLGRVSDVVRLSGEEWVFAGNDAEFQGVVSEYCCDAAWNYCLSFERSGGCLFGSVESGAKGRRR